MDPAVAGRMGRTCTCGGVYLRSLLSTWTAAAKPWPIARVPGATVCRTGIFIPPIPYPALRRAHTDGRALQWSAPTGNGLNVCPARGGQLVPLMGGVVTTCGGGTAAKVSTHNLWDAAMANAFGATAASVTALAAMAPSRGMLPSTPMVRDCRLSTPVRRWPGRRRLSARLHAQSSDRGGASAIPVR